MAPVFYYKRYQGWWVALLLFFPLLGASGIGSAATPLASDKSTTYVYSCDGEAQTIVVIINGERGHLFARQANQPLRKQPGSAGFAGRDVHYLPRGPVGEAPGQMAVITIGERQLVSCRNNPSAAAWEGAKLRGVSYRAFGNEPAWILEIDRQKGLLLMTGTPALRKTFPYVKPLSEESQKTSRYRSRLGEDGIEITVTGEPCRDSMSGESFSSRVAIDWRGKTLIGCGRPLH